MQIICDYCGHAIDTDNEEHCEHCGASYKDNERYRELQHMIIEKNQIELEERKSKHKDNIDERARQDKIKKIVKIIFVIYFLTSFVIPFIVGVIIGLTEFVQEETSVDEDVLINEVMGLNVWAETENYSVQITDVKETEYVGITPREGYYLIVIHFSIKNTSKDYFSLHDSRVDLICNDRKQKLITSYDPENATYIKPNHILSGYYVYEVPQNCKQFIFEYNQTKIKFSSLNIEPLDY
jgi:hypothetical protein